MRTFKFNKKHIPALILAAVCLVVAVLCIVKAVDDIKYHEELTQSSIIDITQTILTADGGNGKKVPKNTYLAIDDLHIKGFTSVKIDARLTGDKKWVALADENISVATNGHGKVSEYKYYELLNYNIKGAPVFSKAVIELVRDTAKYAYDNSITPIVYVHNYSKKPIRSLIGELTEMLNNSFYIASADKRTIEYAKTVLPTLMCIYYVDEITDEDIEFCRQNTSVSLCFNAANKNNTYDKIEKIFSAEILSACYGAETLEEIEKFYKTGVRHFINDSIEPGVLQ